MPGPISVTIMTGACVVQSQQAKCIFFDKDIDAIASFAKLSAKPDGAHQEVFHQHVHTRELTSCAQPLKSCLRSSTMYLSSTLC